MACANNKLFGKILIGKFLCSKTILRDPGADEGGEGKSKWAEKYIWNEEK